MTEDYSSKALRAAMKAKAERLASGSDATHIGASTFTPAEPLNADVQTGARPLTRRRFKSGGKVSGATNAPRADKKKRGNAALSPDNFINRDVVAANEEREGKKHVGGFKKGGRAEKCGGGEMKRGKFKIGGTDPRPIKDIPLTSPNHPVNKDYSTRSLTDSKGRQVTSEELLEEANRPAPMPPEMPDSIREMRNKPVPLPPSRPANLKKGGRAKKFMGGPMMQPGGMMSAAPQGPSGQIVDKRDEMVNKNRMNFGTGPSGSPYKKGGKVAFEGSAKDEAQDAKLAKKYGMSMAAWEKSKMDKKHDEQESMEGLKAGGKAGGKWIQGAIKHKGALHKTLGVPADKKIPEKKLEKAEHSSNPTTAKRARLAETLEGMHHKKGGRAERKAGGRTKINIVIATGKGQQDGMMPNNGGMPPKQPSPAMPVQTPPVGVMPPMAGAGAPPAGAPAGAPPMPSMGRKAGGKVYRSYKDMDAGAGSGMGRLEKTEIAERKGHKHGGKTYKSYKDMDAGAASGKGRLEKTEIAARSH